MPPPPPGIAEEAQPAEAEVAEAGAAEAGPAKAEGAASAPEEDAAAVAQAVALREMEIEALTEGVVKEFYRLSKGMLRLSQLSIEEAELLTVEEQNLLYYFSEVMFGNLFLADTEMEALSEEYDKGGSGNIHYLDFIETIESNPISSFARRSPRALGAALIKVKRFHRSARGKRLLAGTFEQYDTDGMGYISSVDFQAGLQRLSEPDAQDMAAITPMLDGFVGEELESNRHYRTTLEKKVRDLANQLKPALKVALAGVKEESQVEIERMQEHIDHVMEGNARLKQRVTRLREMARELAQELETKRIAFIPKIMEAGLICRWDTAPASVSVADIEARLGGFDGVERVVFHPRMKEALVLVIDAEKGEALMGMLQKGPMEVLRPEKEAAKYYSRLLTR